MAESDDHSDPVSGLTSGDIARLLEVDLKTVHNWVRHGRLYGRRTQGRHLRFHRTEVVRFIRRSGFDVPKALGDEPPRIVAAGLHSTGKKPRLPRWARTIPFESYSGLFDAVLAVASGEHEVFVVHLQRYPIGLVVEVVASLRRRPMTRGLAVIGVGGSRALRDVFIQRGGDLVVDHESQVRAGVRWLTGDGPLPSGATTLLAKEYN